MAGSGFRRHAGPVPETPSPVRPLVLDLDAHRARREASVAAAAAGPVRHLPAELLEALMGSWGTPDELGLRPARRHLQAVGG